MEYSRERLLETHTKLITEIFKQLDVKGQFRIIYNDEKDAELYRGEVTSTTDEITGGISHVFKLGPIPPYYAYNPKAFSALIAHESGHAYLYEKKLNHPEKDNWFNEFVCDCIASKIIGPDAIIDYLNIILNDRREFGSDKDNFEASFKDFKNKQLTDYYRLATDENNRPCYTHPSLLHRIDVVENIDRYADIKVLLDKIETHPVEIEKLPGVDKNLPGEIENLPGVDKNLPGVDKKILTKNQIFAVSIGLGLVSGSAIGYHYYLKNKPIQCENTQGAEETDLLSKKILEKYFHDTKQKIIKKALLLGLSTGIGIGTGSYFLANLLLKKE